MAAVALLKFSQGALIGADGHALAGVGAASVDAENSDNTDIQSWKLDLVDVPPGSALVVGTLASADNNTPLASFIPDVAGCYRILLTVWAQPGQVGQSDLDIRNFAVPDPISGFIYPPYQDLPRKLPVLGSAVPGEKPDELNFLGQPFGWSGTGADGLMQQFMRTMSTNLGTALNFSYFDIPASGVRIPAGQEMITTQMIGGPGLLIVDGLLTQTPPPPPPFPVQIDPPTITGNVSDYNPPGFSGADIVVVTLDAPWSIRGMNPSVLRKVKRVVNGSGFALTLPHEDLLSSPGSRFLLPGGVPLVIPPGESAETFVDTTAGRWRAE